MGCTPFVPKTNIEKHFAWIASIPHGSFNEHALSSAIREKAEQAGLWTYQDELGNLLVRRPASPGCEHKAPVILQAHLDMVCTKIPGSSHDFLKDPLKLVVDEEGWLHAEETSLGADDGLGVAYMIDLMLRNDLALPELELLFTVQEETGMGGARHFDCSLLRGRRMIGLDCGGEYVTAVSSCGSRRMIFTLPLQEKKPQGTLYRIVIGGLTGGHSGNVGGGHANAIKLLGHLLRSLEETGAALVSGEGGEADNAIPRDASALLCIPDGAAGRAQEIVETMGKGYRKIHRTTDPGMEISLISEEGTAEKAYSLRCARLLVALRDGPYARDAEHPMRNALSSNLGILKIGDGKLVVNSMLRSTAVEWEEFLAEQLTTVCEAFGAECSTDSQYSGWEYNPDSELRRLYFEAVQEVLGHEMTETFAAGGLEPGIFSGRIPDMDIIEMQCTMSGLHSPSEKADIASFNRMYDVLVKLIERLP